MSSRIYVDKVTFGTVTLFQVTSNPNGVLPGSPGDLAVRTDSGNVTTYQNTDGATAWAVVPGSDLTAGALYAVWNPTDPPQTFPDATPTVILWPSVLVNEPGGFAYDAGNGEFTCLKTRVFDVQAVVQALAGTAGSTRNANLQTNSGSGWSNDFAFSAVFSMPTAPAFPNAMLWGRAPIICNAGDKIRFRTRSDGEVGTPGIGYSLGPTSYVNISVNMALSAALGYI
jgi:hypothetical protein